MDDTIPALLLARVDQSQDDVAFHHLEGGSWQTRRWRESAGDIAATARMLADLGVRKGTPVAILSETRPEWTMFDLAILSLGGITVGVYPSLLAEGVAFQLTHAKVEVVISALMFPLVKRHYCDDQSCGSAAEAVQRFASAKSSMPFATRLRFVLMIEALIQVLVSDELR